MKRFELGPELRLPALEAQTQTLVVYGGKGMGKTNFAAVLAEELARNELRFSWIDPVGVAWGLKHSGDGRGRGVGVLILGGIHGDIPIEPAAGAVVADLVVDEDVSVIVDVSRRGDGRMWSSGEKIRFVRDYCVRLFERQGEERRPLMQLLDEAGRFVPQQMPKGSFDIAECVGAIEQLTELGRNVGVGVTLITQRSARMNKSVSELAEMMVAFRTVGPRSIDAILDWFGEHVPKERQRELIERVRELPVGTALVVSPGWLAVEGEFAIRARETFDSSATPVAGKERRPAGKGAEVDLGKYRERMAETIEKAEASDPRVLQKTIRELRSELAKRPTETKVETVVEERVVEVPVLDGQVEDLERAIAAIREVASPLGAAAQAIEAAAAGIARSLESAFARPAAGAGRTERATTAVQPPRPRAVEAVRRAPARRPAPTAEPAADGDFRPSRPQQKILDTLAWFEAMSLPAPKRTSLAFLAGASPKSSGFEKNLSTLRTAGLLDYPGQGTVGLTPAGEAVAAAPEVPLTSTQLQEEIYRQLGPTRAAYVAALVDVYPNALTREKLAEAIGASPRSSGFEKNLSTLKTFGLITYPQQGWAAATPILFIQDSF